MESLAVKYRPKQWQDVVEQKAVVDILSKQVKQHEIKNCYLFCGPSGCAKTTLARIFANDINKNCGSPIEIDAASNNGVDNVRNLVKLAQERSIDSEYKVVIVDECHSLTNQSWQAFLKCIEEPPKYTIFIFCTTEPQKVPATILNRVQRFNLSRISVEGIRTRLTYICQQEHFTNYLETVDYISKIANGGMRDAIALLEKSASYSPNLTLDNTLTALGAYPYPKLFELTNSLIDGDEQSILTIIDYFYNDGSDLKVFIDKYLEFIIDLAKYCIFKSMDIIHIPASMETLLSKTTAIDNNTKYFQYVANKLLELKNLVKNDMNIKVTLEVIMLQIARCQ